MIQPTILERDAGESAKDFAERIRHGLSRAKLILTKGVPPDEDARPFWDTVSETLGECLLIAEDAQTGNKLGQKWMEIRYDPKFPNAYRHSKNAQPLHTDGSYVSNAPEITFFYCLKQARAGGETTFIDSTDVCELLRAEDPGLLTALRATPVVFSKADDRRRRKIIDEDAEGLVMNWNYYCVDPAEPAEVKDLAERFHAFCQTRIVGERRTYPLRLEPGHAVFFRDERLLHGRNSFDASDANDRFFWKGGITLWKTPPA